MTLKYTDCSVRVCIVVRSNTTHTLSEVSPMNFSGLFDLEFRFRDIDKDGDPLVNLNTLVDWEDFRDDLKDVYAKDPKSPAGRKPIDPLLMLKILILPFILE